MWALSAATRIYLAPGPTDLRKGFEGLYGLMRDRLQVCPQSGHLGLFCNRDRTRLKLLYWDSDGFMDLHETAGAGPIQLARGRGYRRGQSRVKSGGTGLIAGRHRAQADAAQSLVRAPGRKSDPSGLKKLAEN
jgi:IS66 Orf2 like protein